MINPIYIKFNYQLIIELKYKTYKHQNLELYISAPPFHSRCLSCRIEFTRFYAATAAFTFSHTSILSLILSLSPSLS